MAESAEEFRCFIGGLSWSTSDSSLREAFGKFGHLVDAKVVVDRFSGRSRGFGFVTFDDEKAMEDAMRAMDGMNLDGRAITVDKAQPSGRDRDGGSYRDRDHGGRDRDYGGRKGPDNRGECFKCGQQGHFARECPSGEGASDDKYDSSRGNGWGGGGGNHYGPDRNGDRYGGRNRDGGHGGGTGTDRYGRDRSGPYKRPGAGGYRS